MRQSLLLCSSADREMVDLDLLAANGVVHCLRTVQTLPPDHYFLCNMGRLSNNRLFDRLGDLDGLIRPVYFLRIVRIGNRAAHDFRVLFVKGDVRFYGLLSMT